MSTHFSRYPDDDEPEQAPCGIWMGDASELSSNWANVDCKRCLKWKDVIMATHAAEESAIVEQMGDMAEFMKRTAGEQMTDSVSIYKLGIYGKAYDVPGTRRAYTYQHQPDNQGAWRLGEAMSIASKAGGGDYIDTGLGMLKQLELKGYGVYELEEAGAPEERPDLIRFDFINADGQPDSKMITHDEMRERYSALYQQSESSLEREQIALAHADAADDLRAQIDRLRAALHSCAKASSAAEVDLIVDEALAPEVRQPEKPLPRRPEQPEPRPYDYRPDGEWRIDTSAGREILVYKDCSVIEAEDARYVLRLISAEQGERQEAVPEETPHIIVFDDADRPNEMFSGAGARPAALRRWEQISVSWNAHLFVRVERNSRDDPYPCARLATNVNRIPAGLYAELDALRTLRDATGVYLQGYMRDEIEDEDNCVTVDQHDAACSVKAALDSSRALEWKGCGDA